MKNPTDENGTERYVLHEDFAPTTKQIKEGDFIKVKLFKSYNIKLWNNGLVSVKIIKGVKSWSKKMTKPKALVTIIKNGMVPDNILKILKIKKTRDKELLVNNYGVVFSEFQCNLILTVFINSNKKRSYKFLSKKIIDFYGID